MNSKKSLLFTFFYNETFLQLWHPTNVSNNIHIIPQLHFHMPFEFTAVPSASHNKQALSYNCIIKNTAFHL